MALSGIAACGGSTSGDSSGGSAGAGATGGSSGSGGSAQAGCPSSFPSNGASCSLPSGSWCAYPNQNPCCTDFMAQCLDGQWMATPASCNPPPPPPCPSEVPEPGSACGSSDACGSGQQYCGYEQCADGSTRLEAQCVYGAWTVSEPKCAPPPCEGLSACQCFDRADCKALSDSCICPCDYECAGKPPCSCACGGGEYLGCATATP
ncbi:MAG: hypothetical protein KF718_27565 [Polyangiaceae bacterium]|nr:hypothetical protein [Polyangiaceae bacterium]